MFRCPECAHELPATPADGTPCPICGTDLRPTPPTELDPAWVAAKEAKQAAAAAPPKPSRKVAVVILTGVMLVVVAVAVIMVMQRQPNAKGEALSGVELTITAPRVVSVTVDGAPAGKTPVSLRIKGRTRPIVISGGGVTKQVTPDHDQIINLVP